MSNSDLQDKKYYSYPQQVTQSLGPSLQTLQYLQCSEGQEQEEQYEHHLQLLHSLHFVDHGQRV